MFVYSFSGLITVQNAILEPFWWREIVAWDRATIPRARIFPLGHVRMCAIRWAIFQFPSKAAGVGRPSSFQHGAETFARTSTPREHAAQAA